MTGTVFAITAGHLRVRLQIWYTHTLLSAHGHVRCDVAFFPFTPDPLLVGDELLARQQAHGDSSEVRPPAAAAAARPPSGKAAA